jgi:hypothetical protein
MSDIINEAQNQINEENVNTINNNVQKKKEELANSMNNLVNKNKIVVTAASTVIVNILGFLFFTMVWNKQDEYALMKNGNKKYILMKSFIMLIYIILNIGIIYFISQKVCSSPQLLTSIRIVIVNFILFILLTQLVLYVLPGFLEPFSNIVGTALISSNMFNLDELIQTLLLEPDEGGEVVQKIVEDPTILVTSLTPDTLESDIEKMREDKKRPIIKKEENWRKLADKISDPEEKKSFEEKNQHVVKNLKKLLRLRDSVSYFIWLLLAGLMFSSTNINQIMNITTCAGSASEEINNRMDKTSGQISAIKSL